MVSFVLMPFDWYPWNDLTLSRTQSALPVLEPSGPASSARRALVHGLRVMLLVAILVVVRYANQKRTDLQYDLSSDPVATALVKSTFTDGAEFQIRPSGVEDEWEVVAEGGRAGHLIRTSPQSDNITGFSGPTDCLIALDNDYRIVSVGILSSRDTVEHVDLIMDTPEFFSAFSQKSAADPSWADIDAVSGATLTSYAIVASVAKRISGRQPALKFAAEPTIEKVQILFPQAQSLMPAVERSMWTVNDKQGDPLGKVLSTSPVADHLVGYQGPTATLIGLDVATGKCVGLAVDQTYDNQPYASYLGKGDGFQKKYKGKLLSELTKMEPQSLGIEGISGATMTSMCIAEAIPMATTAALSKVSTDSTSSKENVVMRDWWSYVADFITIALTLIGIAFSLTKLSRLRWLRVGYQIAVVVLLGFYSGHMLSQASVAGWAAHTVPWSLAPGLVALSFAALAVPMFSKHQPYCQHICPFGVLQQWARSPSVKRVVPWKMTILRGLAMVLRCVPIALLAIVVVAAVSGSRFSLASIEPFDGFDFRIAGWATSAIFVVGLLFSFVSPMAYCRFGCPTGAMLGYLRFRGDSHRLGLRDLVAVCLLVLAIYFLWV